jgi:hypothetical protein
MRFKVRGSDGTSQTPEVRERDEEGTDETADVRRENLNTWVNWTSKYSDKGKKWNDHQRSIPKEHVSNSSVNIGR